MLRVLIEYWYIKDAVISLLIILIFFWIVFKQLTYHLNAHFSWNLLFWKRSYLDNSIFQQGIIKICFLLQFIPRKKPKGARWCWWPHRRKGWGAGGRVVEDIVKNDLVETKHRPTLFQLILFQRLCRKSHGKSQKESENKRTKKLRARYFEELKQYFYVGELFLVKRAEILFSILNDIMH